MTISINDIKITPNQNLDSDIFKVCVFGKPSEKVQEWINFHKLETEESGKFTNIILTKNNDIDILFEKENEYHYVDGFSPNLNKHLHIGHLSNLILAKAFQSLGIGTNFIAILGDTLDGKVSHDEALKSYLDLTKLYGYRVDEIYKASEQVYEGDLLKDGQEKYEGTKVFEFQDNSKMVGIKSNGSTSYFYQDVALASNLSNTTLYLTGNEQNNHFNYLKELFPTVKHLGLGLVTADGKKWSSRNGDVIYAQEILDNITESFNNDKYLAYNILVGQILKSLPKNNKEIKMKHLSNPKTSFGLYLSYTLARMKNTGLKYEILDTYNSIEINFMEKKSKVNLSPNLLFNALVELCKEINALYGKYSIKEDPTNEKYFTPLVQDLELGMKKLGMFSVNKV